VYANSPTLSKPQATRWRRGRRVRCAGRAAAVARARRSRARAAHV